jgi:hypothetical protein
MRKPMELRPLDGEKAVRPEERRRLPELSQLPARIARFSDEELCEPSLARSFHTHTLSPWPIVPYGLKLPALFIMDRTEAALS